MIVNSNVSRIMVCLGVLCLASCKRADEAKIPVVSLEDIPGVSIGIAVLCDSASETNGKLKIDGAVDAVAARSFPTVHPKFTLVYRIIFTPAEYRKHDFKLRFIDPDGVSFGGEMEGQIDVSTTKAENPFLSQNVTINLRDLRLEKPGVYCIQLWFDGKLLNQSHFVAKQV